MQLNQNYRRSCAHQSRRLARGWSSTARRARSPTICAAARTNIHGYQGDDRLFGQGGNDQIYGDAGNDTIEAGQGDDWAVGGAGDDRVFGDGGADVLMGGDERDTLDGGEGDDVIHGGGDDQINGQGGDDIIFGDAGADTMIGGGGADVFRFDLISDSTAAAPDHIVGFQRVTDIIDVSSIDADLTAVGDQAFHFVSAFTHHAGEALLVFSKGVTEFELDQNGDGVADFALKFSGRLTAADTANCIL